MKTISSFVLVLAAASACAPKVNDPSDAQAIRRTMDDSFKAANVNDTAASVAMMTDKTVLFEPHTATLVGKEAIGKLHQAFLDRYRIDARSAAITDPAPEGWRPPPGITAASSTSATGG